MVEKRKKLLRTVTLISIILVQVVLILVYAGIEAKHFMYSKLCFSDIFWMYFIILLILWAIIDRILIYALFKANKFYKIIITILALVVLSYLSVPAFLSSTEYCWSSKTDDVEDFMILDERASETLEREFPSEFFEIKSSHVQEYYYFYRHDMDEVIDIDYTAILPKTEFDEFVARVSTLETVTHEVTESGGVIVYSPELDYDVKTHVCKITYSNATGEIKLELDYLYLYQ